MKKMKELDRWDVTPSEGIQIQKRLSKIIRRRWDGRKIALIAGTDVHFPSRDIARAAIAVVTYPNLTLVDSCVEESPCNVPYIPGLLSFREIPPLIEAWKKLEQKPDVILCDGQGIAHPRGLGLASHLGIVLGLPTVGCAKSPLFGEFEKPGQTKGDRTPIRDKGGKTIGTVLRTRDGTRSLYISVGHLIDLRTAVRIVLCCTPRYRIPEPLRTAHRLAGAYGEVPVE